MPATGSTACTSAHPAGHSGPAGVAISAIQCEVPRSTLSTSVGPVVAWAFSM